MPTMADITVLNAAAGNVVYVAKTPSAGDRVPARWSADSLATIPGQRPTFLVVTRDNAKQNARVFEASFRFPILGTNLATGYSEVLATVPIQVTGTLPNNVDASKVNDAFVQLGNLVASTLIRSVASTGYAPT